MQYVLYTSLYIYHQQMRSPAPSVYYGIWMFLAHGWVGDMSVSENVVYPIVPNGFADHYPNQKWLAIIGKINPTFSGPKPYGSYMVNNNGYYMVNHDS